MAITKIEDLPGYFLDPFTKYYDSKYVEELVNHLQSKLLKWRKAEDDEPNIGEWCVFLG